MLSLQKTFIYEGDVSLSPVDEISLKFKIPTFEYIADTHLKPIRRIKAEVNISTKKSLHDKNYSANIPSTSIIGEDAQQMLYFFLRLQMLSLDRGSKTADYSFPIEVSSYVGNTLHSANNLEAIVYVRINPLYQFIKDNNLFEIIRDKDKLKNAFEEIKASFERNSFLLNRKVFENSLEEFTTFAPSDVPYTVPTVLLLLIQRIIDLRGINPITFNSFIPLDLDELSLIQNVFRDENNNEVILPFTNQQGVLDFFNKYLPILLDFPISIPELKSKTLDVAGTFKIKADDNIKVTKEELHYYDIFLEFINTEIEDGNAYNLKQYDWSNNNNVINDNTISITFTEVKKIRYFGSKNQVKIYVKDFNGALLWVKDYNADDLELKNIQIEVPWHKPNTLTKPNDKVTTDSSKKLRGQIVDLSKKCPLNNLTVIIQAKEIDEEPWRIVGAANTDKAGNFSMAYPFGDYIAAQAIVSLTPNSPADIPIKSEQKGQTISNDFLYLLVKGVDCTNESKEEDCDCNSLKKASRLPDQKDLIASDEYTQDVGGACINLSTPNRTLSEYSYQAIVRTSDPDVANYTLLKGSDGKFTLERGIEIIDRSKSKINFENPIRWQDAPDSNNNLSIYQSVTVATGHILHYKVEFRADGYSLGDLLYSLPLAPGQKKQIVVFDSVHSLQGAETQAISQRESLVADIANERGILDEIGGNINETLRGSSSASTGGVSAGLGVGAQMGMFGGALGVAGGYANATSSASQNSSRSISQSFGEKLRQAITQRAESYRQLNTSIVTTVQQGQRYSATTEVVANHNHCHALTMMYFEVLRHYAIFQKLANVEECVFVPFLMTNFTEENMYKWSDVLAKHLLPMHSNTYLQPFGFLKLFRQHPLLKAFDAIERKRKNYIDVDFPEGRYCDDSITSITGSLRIKANIPRPKTRFDRILSLPLITRTTTTAGGPDVQGTIQDVHKSILVGAFTGGLSAIFGGGPSVKYTTVTNIEITRGQIFDEFMTLDANYESVPPAQCVRVHSFDPKTINVDGKGVIIEFFENNSDKDLWKAYSRILDYKDEFVLLNKFKGNVISDWDRIFNENIAPQIIEKLINESRVNISPFNRIDLTSLQKYTGSNQTLRYNFRSTTSLTRAKIENIQVKYSFTIISTLVNDLATLQIHGVKLLLEDLNINYSTNYYNGRIYSGYVGDDLMDKNFDIPTPLNADEKRNPKKEDEYIINKLIEHLNSNLEYYNKILWYNLDVDRRYMLLDGFSIQVYNDFGILDGLRSLASVVKNEVIAIAGNSLVFPVAAGYKVSRSYIMAKNQEGEQEQVSLYDHYKPFTPIPPYRISVPTKGVYLEAIQGACDACEMVKENSSQDWDKFRTEEPTPFSPITTPVPTITDWKPNIKDFASPIVNIQNAPATPAPGAGLAGITELMGKAGIFKDITGLDANQQNVIRTYLSNQENAKAFAEMAKGLSMQGHNTQNSPKIMDTLKTAKDSGAINKDDYGKLVKKHLQQQIDGGETRKAEAESQKPTKPSLTDAAIDAAARGNDVEATKTDDSGNTESIKISSNDKVSSLVSNINIGPFAETRMSLNSLGFKEDQSLNQSLDKISSGTSVRCLGLINIADKKFASSHGDEMWSIFSVGKVGVAIAAYRLREQVREFAKQSQATIKEDLISELRKVWMKTIREGTWVNDPKGFPNIERIFSLSYTLLTGWSIDFSDSGQTKLSDFDEQVTNPGSETCDRNYGFKQRMELMVAVSNNEATTLCIRDLSFSYINGALLAEGFNSKGSGSDGTGFWVGAGYPPANDSWASPRYPAGKPGGSPQSASVNGLLMLMAALETSKFISSAVSGEIVALLKTSGTFHQMAYDTANPKRTTKVIYGKDGKNTDVLYTDIALCKTSSGKRNVSVIVHANGFDKFSKAALEMEKLM